MLVRRALLSRCTYMSIGWQAGADIRRARMAQTDWPSEPKKRKNLRDLAFAKARVPPARHQRSNNLKSRNYLY